MEICRAGVLATAAREAPPGPDREHVTLFVSARPERFRTGWLGAPEDLSDLRWTVDTPADFAFVERVYERLYPGNPAFTTGDVLALDFEHRAKDA